MGLRRKYIHLEKGGRCISYIVPLENPFHGRESGTLFNRLFVSMPKKLFNEGCEEEVLEFYRTNPLLLDINPYERPIHKVGGVYFAEGSDYSFFHSDKNINMHVWEFNRVDLDISRARAVRSLMSVVSDNDLSLGARAIIRRVAVSNLMTALNLAATSKSCSPYVLGVCENLHSNECALNELQSYGFDVSGNRPIDKKELVGFDVRNR